MAALAWFDRPSIEGAARGCVERLDRWRTEYDRLDAERDAIAVVSGSSP
jgi:hypothetical protein